MLNDLATKKNITIFSISPENMTGEKGRGGMATEGKKVNENLTNWDLAGGANIN